ncbi:unnamed protein product [marine sediment metagenome]|uniref:Uncharacterized protein n=1 Tax=marine sediment metagenome TaxID=412755 RepID=X0ZII2_9ZZZZ
MKQRNLLKVEQNQINMAKEKEAPKDEEESEDNTESVKFKQSQEE